MSDFLIGFLVSLIFNFVYYLFAGVLTIMSMHAYKSHQQPVFWQMVMFFGFFAILPVAGFVYWLIHEKDLPTQTGAACAFLLVLGLLAWAAEVYL